MNPTDIRPPLDTQDLRRVFASFPSGVAAVAAEVDGRPVGLAASSFVSVSLAPPLVSVCFALTSQTWPTLRQAPRVGISVFSASQEIACRQMAGPEERRFTGVEHTVDADGAIRLDDAAAWFGCSVYDEVEAGDHTVVLFEIHQQVAVPGVDPLVFHASNFKQLVAR